MGDGIRRERERGGIRFRHAKKPRARSGLEEDNIQQLIKMKGKPKQEI